MDIKTCVPPHKLQKPSHHRLDTNIYNMPIILGVSDHLVHTQKQNDTVDLRQSLCIRNTCFS